MRAGRLPRLGIVALALALGLGVAGCRSILAIEELTLDPPDLDAASDAAPDGAIIGDASVGCGSCTVVVDDEPTPTELGTLAGRLAWIRSGSGGNVVARDFDGGAIAIGSETPVSFAHDLTIAEGAAHAVGDDGVFRRFLDQSSCTDAEGVMRLAAFSGGEMLVLKAKELSRGGCGGHTVILTDELVAVAGDPPYAWYARSNGELSRCDATKGSCAASAELLVSGQAEVKALAVGTSRVAWLVATANGAELRAASKVALGTNPTPTTVAVLTELPKVLVTDDDRAYWTESTAGRVRTAPLAGGETTSLADGLDRPWGLLVTARHVYVSESGAGRIVAIPR